MVLKPTDCLDPTEEETRMFDAAEASIDAHLKSNFGRNGMNQATVNASTFTSNQLVRQKLVRAYEAAGWEVKFQSDQRDGDFYFFSKRAPLPSTGYKD